MLLFNFIFFRLKVNEYMCYLIINTRIFIYEAMLRWRVKYSHSR